MDMGGGALLHPPESLRGHERRDQHLDHRERDHDQDDDLGPETSVDDGELQRQQLSDLDPAAEPRQEAPTPPAASLLPGQCEPDNVADSGEDSEDEWNYYKVEPTEKPVDVESLVQTKQPVCPESTQFSLEGKPEDILDMESRLNPDAKEFVPSPTHSKPSFEDAIISQSPVGKILPFDDNVEVPSMAQFQQEISQRPGEVSLEDALSNNGFSRDSQSDILNGGSIMDDTIQKKYGDFELTEQNLATFTSNNPFEISEVSSTKAVYGDESVASFMTSTSDILQKNLGTSASNVEGSFTETDFVASETSGVKQSEDLLGFEASSEFTEFKKGLDESLPTDFSPVKETGTISFELQKDIAPVMEECPERVKLTDDLINPFSHEQPIAEMPMEESEQLTENERTDVLNKSFEHGHDFTLDAYELASPLNPCAPSFDFRNVEDGSDVPKLDEINKNVETVEQKPTDVSSDLAYSVPISQTISSESPTEQLDVAQKELTELNEDIVSSEDGKALLPEVNSELDNISSFEQGEDYLNRSSQSEKSEKDAISQSSGSVLDLEQSSVEVHDLKPTELIENKDFMDELPATPSELANEFQCRTTELVEPFNMEYEFKQSLDQATLEELRKDATEPVEELRKDATEPVEELRKDAAEPVEELRKDAAEPVEELRKDAAEPMEALRKDTAEPVEELRKDTAEPVEELRKDAAESVEELRKDAAEPLEELRKDSAKSSKFEDELHGDGVQLLDPLHREANDLREDVRELLETKYSETVQHLPDVHDIQPASDPLDMMQSDIVEPTDSNNETHTEQRVAIEERLVFEVASTPVEAIQSQKGAPSAEQIMNLSAPELCDVPEALRVCVYPMPPENSKMKEDVELLSPSLDSKEEKREPLEKEHINGADFVTGAKLESLSGEQRDMVDTMLSGISYKTELEEQNDLTSNAGNNDVAVSVETVSRLAETEIIEKTEEIAENTVERKDVFTVEQTMEKLEAIDIKPVSGETLKLFDADPSHVETISDTAVGKDGHDIEVSKAIDGEEVPVTTKTPPPTPTPASQAEVTGDRDAPAEKAESTAAAVAVAAAAVAGITAAATGVTTRKEPASKKQVTPISKDLKKSPVAKDSDKMKPGTKAPVKQSPGTTKVAMKTSPTSPTKLSVPSTPRTSTPKRTQATPPAGATKPAAKTTTAAKSLSRPTSAVASKPTSLTTQKPSPTTMGKVSASSIAPKPGLKAASSTTTKPSQTVRAASAPKPRVPSATTTATKGPLSNGDVKSAEVKKSSVATSKLAPRSHTAPSRTTTIPKTAGTTAAASVPKTGVQARTALTNRTGMTNGIGQKPRVPSSTAPSSRPATNHQTATDKQHKETANKHISSRRVGTVPTKTLPAKVGVKKSPATAKGGKAPPATNGSPLISMGTGDETKKDPLL